MCSLMQVRRLSFPGGIPGHSLLRSAPQCPTLRCWTVWSCAVAFDDPNIKMAPIIRMIFTTEVLHGRYVNLKQTTLLTCACGALDLTIKLVRIVTQ
jgi:hypothetical protein